MGDRVKGKDCLPEKTVKEHYPVKPAQKYEKKGGVRLSQNDEKMK